MFVATAQPLELFTGVELATDLPDGRAVRWAARVVHVLRGSKAERLRSQAGMGVQFEGLSERQLADVRLLVAWARANDPRPRIPRARPGVSPSMLESEPMLAYVLEHVDGKRDPEALADEIGIEVTSVEQYLGELSQKQLIELVAAGGRASGAASAPNPYPTPKPANTQTTAATAQRAEPAPDPGSLARNQAALLDDLERCLLVGNFYNLLDVREDATQDMVRAGFEVRSRGLRVSDAPPAEVSRVERMQHYLLDAYGVLSNPRRRFEYNQYLERGRQLAETESLRPVNATRDPEPGGTHSAPTTVAHELPGVRDRRDAAAPKPVRSRWRGPLAAAAGVIGQAQAVVASRKQVATQLQAAKAALLNVPSVRTGVAHLKALASRTLINDYEDQAVYEESQQRWQLAGRSWLRVAEGRPDDSLPLQRAAHAQLQAGVDLRKVVPVAKRAVALAPNDARAHRILARAYLAGGMQLEARRELEIARRCPAPPAPPPAASLPRHLMQRLLDRTIAYRARSE